jgi:hypothetical protein
MSRYEWLNGGQGMESNIAGKLEDVDHRYSMPSGLGTFLCLSRALDAIEINVAMEGHSRLGRLLSLFSLSISSVGNRLVAVQLVHCFVCVSIDCRSIG